MTALHTALIVEDDQATAEDLVEILASIDSVCTVTDNRQDALRLLAEKTFCIVLLDLQIKQTAGSIKGHVAQGKALLRESRMSCGQNRGAAMWTPIVIVSGHANEVDEAVTMMRDGADDIIRKPLALDDVVRRVRKALDAAGRRTHELCAAAAAGTSERTRPVLRIPGDLKGDRAKVTVSGKVAWLPVSSMRVLLQLAIARQSETFVHKRTLGAKHDEGFKVISRLREHLQPALADGMDLVANDHHGGYTLKREVLVAGCDVANLEQLGDTRITELATSLSTMLGSRQQET